MKKALAGGLAVIAVLLVGTFAGAARASEGGNLDCSEAWSLCAEPESSIGYDGEYTGHDEPSLLFYSNQEGSGNSSIYNLTLPEESRIMPNQAGTGGTWNFQLRPAFWLGMALCDNQSAPEFTHAPCTPDSDTNIKDGSDPNAADYIGRHAGTAFLELQFYPPGWAPWPPGVSCDAHKWCAAMAIFSLNNDYNNAVPNNTDCLNTVGIEPANFAFVTLSGTPHAPPSPLLATGDTFTPHSSSDLFMNGGDRLRVDIHDTAAGLITVIHDLTTGQVGSMTASVANGFAQVNFEPNPATCSQSPYAFHPMYATASEHTRVPWAAHTYNVAFSDEIGHFENCLVVDAAFNCAKAGFQDPGGLDPDDDNNFCVPGSDSSLVHINGCFSGDGDWDGQSYRLDWPGTDPNVSRDRRLHPQPVLFTSPLANGDTNYARIAFETDLPRIEVAGAQDNPPFCDRTTGADCVNPPNGAAFYPFYSTRMHAGTCTWQEGGDFIPGTINDFGGSSTTEYGSLLLTVYPTVGFTTVSRYNNFNSGDIANPCRVS
jgi:hypothetical protein